MQHIGELHRIEGGLERVDDVARGFHEIDASHTTPTVPPSLDSTRASEAVMAQHPIEMILLRQWASTMAIPIWMCDADGNLIYYNEPAEVVLGIRFDEAGEIPAADVADKFVTTDLDGSPLLPEQLPLVIALTRAEPSHKPLRFKAGDGSWRVVEVTAIPVTGHADRVLGAVTLFWEPPL